MGQGQDILAMSRLEVAHKQGHWVILNNIHLMPVWCVELEKKLDQFNIAGNHPGMRVFLTAEPSKTLPIGILSRSIKLTNEPPSGLKANLMRSIASFKPEDFDDNEPKVRAIMFGLAHFHAILMGVVIEGIGFYGIAEFYIFMCENSIITSLTNSLIITSIYGWFWFVIFFATYRKLFGN